MDDADEIFCLPLRGACGRLYILEGEVCPYHMLFPLQVDQTLLAATMPPTMQAWNVMPC